MKVRSSLALLLVILTVLSIVFTGCMEVQAPDTAGQAQADADANAEAEADSDESLVVDDMDDYAWWWYYGGYSSSTQKATQKATQMATQKATASTSTSSKKGASLASVKTYSGQPYAVVYNNEPDFKTSELTTNAYEFYSPLDSTGRCGYVQACVGKELMPTGSRGSISSVKPTGWKQKTYDTKLVNGGSLYNRCHLIGWQLTGENANKKNLITGTRYMNENMIPFEDMIADYIKETGNHVMYRVTPIFDGKNLVASGVHMEAYSVEDNGKEICFNVYLYNVQPGITINYATGDSQLASTTSSGTSGTNGTSGTSGTTDTATKYILNTGSKRIHTTTCTSASTISAKNKKEYTGSLDSLISQGYKVCGSCKPQ